MKLILHIGFPKTGTTAIQYALRDAKESIEEHGVGYPLFDNDFKQRWVKNFVAKEGAESFISQEADTYRSELLSYIQSGIHVVVMSCEELTNGFMTDFSQASLIRLRDFLLTIFDEIELIAYLRAPDSFYLSMMQEKVKRAPGLVSPMDFRTNYHFILSSFQKAFDSPLTVRSFERDKLYNGDIVEDFFQSIGMHSLVDECSVCAPTTNESASVEVMYLWNETRVQDSFSYWLTKGRNDHEQYWRKIQRIARTQKGLSKPKLKREVACMVAAANAEDMSLVMKSFNVCFSKPNGFQGFNPDEFCFEPGKLSVDGVCDVDMDKVMSLVGVLMCESESVLTK